MPTGSDGYKPAYVTAWQTYLDLLEQAVDKLEADIGEAARMPETWTAAWHKATAQVIDALHGILFSIDEPRWSRPPDTARIDGLQRRMQAVEATYRQLYPCSGSAAGSARPPATSM